MQGIPIVFKLERITEMPILKITGMAKPMSEIDKFMISKAVEIIGKAEKHKGQAVVPKNDDFMEDISKEITAIRLYVAFLNEADLKAAISTLQKELG